MARPREASKGAGTMILLNTTSFSGASSTSINDVFSSLYNNYKIIIGLTSQTGGGTDIALRMRISGSDNTTSGNYRWSGHYVASNGSAVSGVFSGASESAFRIGEMSEQGHIEITIFNPFASQETGFSGTNININSTPVEYNFARGGIMIVTTSYTGFTIFPTSGGTITGTVSTYGIRN